MAASGDQHHEAKAAGRAMTDSVEEVKTAFVAFFHWWWNQPGTNTEQGFDDWAAGPGAGMVSAFSRRAIANTAGEGVRYLTPANFEHEVSQQTQAYQFSEGPKGGWLFRCPEWFDLSAVLAGLSAALSSQGQAEEDDITPEAVQKMRDLAAPHLAGTDLEQIDPPAVGDQRQAARAYIRDWCPDFVKDYVASLTTPFKELS